ncbi:MAG TPA: hypothetical protein VF546_05060 [Pyrinomonadaceae bacterium]|jgi:hypothetical protein
MRRRYLSVGILLVALLMSAWGQVLAAAMCPHMQQDHACCHAQQAAQDDHASHQMAGDMQMTPDAESAQSAEVTASEKPIEGCDHRMGRSSQSPSTVTLREADRTNRGSELAAPTPASRLTDLAQPFTTTVPSREHSPPKASADRHALLSVFRI